MANEAIESLVKNEDKSPTKTGISIDFMSLFMFKIFTSCNVYAANINYFTFKTYISYFKILPYIINVTLLSEYFDTIDFKEIIDKRDNCLLRQKEKQIIKHRINRK